MESSRAELSRAMHSTASSRARGNLDVVEECMFAVFQNDATRERMQNRRNDEAFRELEVCCNLCATQSVCL